MADSDFVRVYPTTHFGYREVTVERPLRLHFQGSAEAAIAAGEELQSNILAALRTMPDGVFKDREAFALALDEHLEAAHLSLSAPLMKAIFAALGERDETAEICRALSRTRPLSAVRDGYTGCRNGDVVVAKITPCFENGKGALLNGLENGVGFGTTELFGSAHHVPLTRDFCITSPPPTRFGNRLPHRCTALAGRSGCRRVTSRTGSSPGSTTRDVALICWWRRFVEVWRNSASIAPLSSPPP